MNRQLPTDEEFVKTLIESHKSHEFYRWAREAFRQIDNEKFEKEEKQLRFTKEESQEAREVLIETFSLASQGRYISEIKKSVLNLLDEQAAKVKTVPVLFLPSEDLNGFAIKTPRGGMLIAINIGIVFQLSQLINAYFSYSTWDAEDPYCHDYSKEEFRNTIIKLAKFAVTADWKQMGEIKTAICPSLPTYLNPVLAKTGTMIVIFILLHEYAHLLLGHIDSAALMPLEAIEGAFVERYTHSQIKEFEADRFALSKILQKVSKDKTGQMAFSAGLLFNYFDLCQRLSKAITGADRSSTHPDPVERWQRIKRASNVDLFPKSLSFWIDHHFACIRHESGIE
jgi:hypothetical protein